MREKRAKILDQTQGEGAMVSNPWKALLRKRIERLDFTQLSADVQPFLERQQDAGLLTAEHFLSLLSQPGKAGTIF